MKYSRKEIDKTGKIMLTATDQETFKQAIEKINAWRSLHLVPLDMLQQKIVTFLDFNNIRPFLISRRLKRLTSIQYKLDLNPEMGLGGMQDIGGLRVGVSPVCNSGYRPVPPCVREQGGFLLLLPMRRRTRLCRYAGRGTQ